MKGNRSSRLAPSLLKKAHEMFRNGYSALDVSESLGFSYTTAKLIRRNMNLTPDQIN